MAQNDEPAREPDPMLRLGGYIRVQRQLADLSLRRLADMTQVSNAYLSQIERGLHQPSLRVLRSIAEALNVSADTLLTQAGLLDPAAVVKAGAAHADATASAPHTADQTAGPIDTEAAIRSDPALTQEEQEALIRIYRSFAKK